jgi:uncharacterized glyoxalase superfamily protein PhnB
MAIAGSQIIPSAHYNDAHAAIDWLCHVFGFAKHAIYEGPNNTIMHAELTLGQGMFMLGSTAKNSKFSDLLTTPAATGGRETTSLCIIIEGCDAAYARAQAAGAEMVQELTEPEHGGKSFACKDPEGHVWWVGSYNPWATRPAAPNAEGTA